MSSKIKSIAGILLIIFLFIFFSYIVQTNMNFFRNLIGTGFSGMILYIIITIIAIVLAPVSTMPLIPVASNLWGVNLAAILSIIGWTIGALIAFLIARKYGVRIVKKIVPIEKINKFEKKIPEKNIFWTIVFLRIILPVDILSYALGLFSRIKTSTYFLATIIGLTPFAFVWAYLGKVPFYYQLFAIIIIGLIFGIWLIIKEILKGKQK